LIDALKSAKEFIIKIKRKITRATLLANNLKKIHHQSREEYTKTRSTTNAPSKLTN
jgi:hypothetical protein